MFETTVIEILKEILEQPAGSAGYKTHENWQARRVAVFISLKLSNDAILLRNHGCWGCTGRSILKLENHESVAPERSIFLRSGSPPALSQITDDQKVECSSLGLW